MSNASLADRTSALGLLHWDNTAGLGPEIYTHRTSDPTEAFVDYFGTRSVAGTVPAATLLVTYRAGESPVASCAVLGDKKQKVVLWQAASR